MRIQIVALLLLILFSCKKEKLEIGEDFDRIIGNWESINGDDKTFIKVKKNGVIVIASSIHRGKKFKVNKSVEMSNYSVESGPEWKGFYCYNEVDLSNQLMYFLKDSNSDTVIFKTGRFIEDFTLIYKDQFFVRDEN
jgi:hypothetical protein